MILILLKSFAYIHSYTNWKMELSLWNWSYKYSSYHCGAAATLIYVNGFHKLALIVCCVLYRNCVSNFCLTECLWWQLNWKVWMRVTDEWMMSRESVRNVWTKVRYTYITLLANQYNAITTTFLCDMHIIYFIKQKWFL